MYSMMLYRTGGLLQIQQKTGATQKAECSSMAPIPLLHVTTAPRLYPCTSVSLKARPSLTLPLLCPCPTNHSHITRTPIQPPNSPNNAFR